MRSKRGRFVAVAAGGTWHAPHIARELHRHGLLAWAMTTIPRKRFLRSGLLPVHKCIWDPIPEVVGPRIGFAGRGRWEPVERHASMFGNHVAIALRLSRIRVANLFASFALEALRMARDEDIAIVVERGSAHVLTRMSIVSAERERLGILAPTGTGSDGMLERELEEYDLAGRIAVPPGFATRSFLERGFLKERLISIDYGVDVRRFPYGDPNGREKMVLSVGNLGIQKGTHLLLDALAEINDPTIKLVLAGTIDTYCLTRLNVLARRLPIEFIGRKSSLDLARLYRRAAVFALPSLQEGQSMAVWEAMASGAAVVVSPWCGFDHILVSGGGIVVDPFDVDRFGAVLKTIVESAEVRAHHSQCARSVASEHTWTHYGYKLAKIYTDMSRVS